VTICQQGDLPRAALRESAAFGDDVLNGPVALLAARLGHDAEGAMLVAALHDADERLHRWPGAVQRQDMVPDVGFTARLGRGVAHRHGAPRQQVVHVFRRAVQLLRAQHELDPAPEQLPGAALRHAAQVAQHDLALLFAGLGRQLRHPPERLLLGGVAHAARVEQHHVGRGLGSSEGIAPGDELGGDRFRIALVHLTAISLDENARHGTLSGADVKRPAAAWKGRR